MPHIMAMNLIPSACFSCLGSKNCFFLLIVLLTALASQCESTVMAECFIFEFHVTSNFITIWSFYDKNMHLFSLGSVLLNKF